jgi:hypothetical protein
MSGAALVTGRQFARCRRYLCWNLFSAVSGRTRILDQAARSIGSLTSLCVNVCHPSTLRMVI